MVTLRCTARLLAKLGIDERPPEPPPPGNALGDWYGDYLYTRPTRLVLLLSERSGLSVIVEAHQLHTLVPRFLRRLEELLVSIGVPAAAVDRELAATSRLAFGATTNRSALGLLNVAVRELKFMLPIEPEASVHELSIRFASRACGKPLRFPRRSPVTSFRHVVGSRSYEVGRPSPLLTQTRLSRRLLGGPAFGDDRATQRPWASPAAQFGARVRQQR